MYVKSKVSIGIFLGILLFTQSVLFAKENNIQKDFINKPASQFRSLDLQIKFPEVQGWEKSGIQKYPTPALGYSVNYECDEGGRVTIYVYNGGRDKVPSDISNQVLKSEIDKAKNEIYQVEKLGHYKNVKELKNETFILGGELGKVESLHSLFSFEAGENKLTSEIYLFSYEDHFIKIRATRLFEEEGTKNDSIITLLSAMDKLFSDDKTVAVIGN